MSHNLLSGIYPSTQTAKKHNPPRASYSPDIASLLAVTFLLKHLPVKLPGGEREAKPGPG